MKVVSLLTLAIALPVAGMVHATSCKDLQTIMNGALQAWKSAQAAEQSCPFQSRPICLGNARAADNAYIYAQDQFQKQCNGDPNFSPFSGNAKPQYWVITLIYAPPGNMSEVDYGSGSTTGVTSDITTSTIAGLEIQFETSFIRTDFETMTGTINGRSLEVRKSQESTLKLLSQEDVLDHGQDTFYVWVNPALSLSVTTPSTASLAVLSTDAVNGPYVVRLTASQLQDPSTIKDSYTLNGVKGFTSDDFKAILKLDPFFSDSDPIAHQPDRFVLNSKSIEIQGPVKEDGSIPLLGGSASTENNIGNKFGIKTDSSASILGGFEWDNVEKAAFFAGLKFETDFEDTTDKTQGTIQEMSWELGSSTVNYDAGYDVYYDRLFKSFAFMPIPDLSNTPVIWTMKLAPSSHLSATPKFVMAHYTNGTTRKIFVGTNGRIRILGNPKDLIRLDYNKTSIPITKAVRTAKSIILH